MSKQQCPEFPYFGAWYPDATCIDGYLWDLDSCDVPGGGLRIGGDAPCPFCNRAEYMKHHHDPLNGVTKKQLREHLAFLDKEYGFKPEEKGGNQ